VSKNKTKAPAAKTLPSNVGPKSEPKANANVNDFEIRRPLLWLAIAAIAVYIPTFFFGLTELDDSIFINEFRAYNEDTNNLITSFARGLFDAVKDPYYRPLFLDSMILNYQIADHGENIASYHVINVLFHVLAVTLLYKVFVRLQIRKLHAFILCLMFAVHPVLSQAVAWIPGRNDTMLAIFTFSFFIYAIDYAEKGTSKAMFLSTLFLALAFFTKETAVFVAPVAFLLLVFVLQKSWKDKRLINLYLSWAACFALWFIMRKAATVQTSGVTPGQIAGDFFSRLPVIIQYLGKIFLPFNLSVFPMQQDTVFYFGIAAVAILAAIIFFSTERNIKVILCGFAIFILFILPALTVPNYLNEQAFEHRLYLPITGILLLLSQTSLFKNKMRDRYLFFSSLAIISVFATLNIRHQQNFSDPKTFWTQAAETSPSSYYANMMLAAREKDDINKAYELFHKAYQINPQGKYINFYYGEMLQRKDSVLASEKYLLEEKRISNYFKCDFYLARVAMEKRDFNGAVGYLQSYLQKDPTNGMGNNNLLLLYIETKQLDAAKGHIRRMKQLGLAVPPAIQAQVGM
jgi:4-amino-4-deoxy-L-arabinose transferase-like glycosyltransferase